MTEITYLKCGVCTESWKVETPADNAALREIVANNSYCPKCNGSFVLHVAYISRNNNHVSQAWGKYGDLKNCGEQHGARNRATQARHNARTRRMQALRAKKANDARTMDEPRR